MFDPMLQDVPALGFQGADQPETTVGIENETLPLAPVPLPVAQATYVSCDTVKFAREEGDNVVFELTFTVSADMGGQTSSGTVTKMVTVNKHSLAADLAAKTNAEPATVIESKVVPKIQGKSVAQRMRELAGIPHRSNFT